MKLLHGKVKPAAANLQCMEKTRALALLTTDPWKFTDLPLVLRDDEDVLSAAVRGLAVKYTGVEDPADGGFLLDCASERLKCDLKVLERLIREHGLRLDWCGMDQECNKQLIYAACEVSALALPRLTVQSDIIFNAGYWETLQQRIWHSSDSQDFALALVAMNRSNWELLPEHLKLGGGLEPFICPICFQLQSVEVWQCTGRGHLFCGECAKYLALRNLMRCPLCRVDSEGRWVRQKSSEKVFGVRNSFAEKMLNELLIAAQKKVVGGFT